MHRTMKTRLLAASIAASLLMSLASAPADPTGTETELKDLVAKIQEKLQAGKKTEADLADELKGFDALLAKHKDEKTDDVAQILFMKAMLYMEVLDNPEKGADLIKQLKRDFPDTKPGQRADEMLDSLKKREEA